MLRRTAVDELPQLWHVLRGDMSLVGPRPVPLPHLERYDERQRRRLEVRPGLTGWAQIHGRASLPWPERLELDVWYVEHQSLALDARILARTAGVLLRRDCRLPRGGRRVAVTEQPELTVVVPAYNEADTIAMVIERLQALPYELQIIVVDDCSEDGTAAVVEGLGDAVELVRHERNQGKGAALRSGFAQARGRIIVIQDADLEYDPVDIPELVAPIRSGVADAVFGSRLIGGRPQRAHLFWHKVGNRALSLLTNVLYNTTLSDMETGYKAFTLEVLRAIEPLYESDFRIEPELTAKICRGGFRIYEVPIAYYGRSYDEGKKITWRDGFPAVYALVKYRFRDR